MSTDSVEVKDALERIARIADVMVGHGPGAYDAYYRVEGRVADGIPTTFQQMRELAVRIRVLAEGVLTS